MSEERDWTETDALHVLAMPLNRYVYHADYGDGVLTLTYSNGSEQGFATERADLVLQMGPMLRHVLHAGIRALAKDAVFQSYLAVLYSGDTKAIIAAEDAVRPPRHDPEPVTVMSTTSTPDGTTRQSATFDTEAEAMTWISDEMIADLERRYPA